MKRTIAVLTAATAAAGAAAILTLPAGATHTKGYAQTASAGFELANAVPVSAPQFCRTTEQPDGTTETKCVGGNFIAAVKSLKVTYDYILSGSAVHLPNIEQLAAEQLPCPTGTEKRPGVLLRIAPARGSFISQATVTAHLNGESLFKEPMPTTVGGSRDESVAGETFRFYAIPCPA